MGDELDERESKELDLDSEGRDLGLSKLLEEDDPEDDEGSMRRRLDGWSVDEG